MTKRCGDIYWPDLCMIQDRFAAPTFAPRRSITGVWSCPGGSLLGWPWLSTRELAHGFLSIFERPTLGVASFRRKPIGRWKIMDEKMGRYIQEAIRIIRRHLKSKPKKTGAFFRRHDCGRSTVCSLPKPGRIPPPKAAGGLPKREARLPPSSNFGSSELHWVSWFF